MSLAMKAATQSLRLRHSPFTSEESIIRALGHRKSDAAPPARLERSCTVERYESDGMPVVTLTPKRNARPIHLLYLHGGAYVRPIVGPHWSIINYLVARTGATVSVPSYSLAPEHHAEETFPKVRALFERLASESSPVVVAGDSAGGGLSACLAIQQRDAGGARPAALLLFSPWLDVTLTNPEIPELEPRDPMLKMVGAAWCGRQWADTLSTRDPRISPVYDNLDGLPRTRIYHGTDILLPDAKLFASKAKAAGSDVELLFYPDGFHVFVGLPCLPESRQALHHASTVISGTLP